MHTIFTVTNISTKSRQLHISQVEIYIWNKIYTTGGKNNCFPLWKQEMHSYQDNQSHSKCCLTINVTQNAIWKTTTNLEKQIYFHACSVNLNRANVHSLMSFVSWQTTVLAPDQHVTPQESRNLLIWRKFQHFHMLMPCFNLGTCVPDTEVQSRL